MAHPGSTTVVLPSCDRAPRFADLVFLTPSCLTRALPVGKSRITVAAPFEGPTCGLLPLGAPATRVTTSGLKWNLDAGELAFGALVSSNDGGQTTALTHWLSRIDSHATVLA